MARKKKCPLIKGACWEEGCMFWKPLIFNRRDGDATVPEVQHDCSINWLFIMLLENSKEVRHTAASADKMANEMRNGAGTLLMRMMTNLHHPHLTDDKLPELTDESPDNER